MKGIRTRAEVVGAGVDKVHEAGAAIELGEEDGGLGLCFGALDPLEAGSDGAAVAAPLPEDPAAVAAHPHAWWTDGGRWRSPLDSKYTKEIEEETLETRREQRSGWDMATWGESWGEWWEIIKASGGVALGLAR